MNARELALVISTACLFLAACGKPNAESDSETVAATPVRVASAEQKNIHALITVDAVLFPVKQATIVPKISAPVARFLVERGTAVHEGQLLAVLEDRDLQAAVQENKQLYEQAEANYRTTISVTMPDDLTKAQTDLEASQQSYDAAQKVFDSREALYRQGALAQRLVEDARLAMVQARGTLETARQHLKAMQSVGQREQRAGARAQLDAAKARYDGALAQVSYAEVRSPISGVIADRPVSVGDMASSSTALLSVVDVSRVIARANMPLNQANKLRVGQAAKISDAQTELPGRVTVVSPAVDPNTTTLQVWIEAANRKEALKLGTTVQVEVDAGDVPGALVVPVAALLAGENGGQRIMIVGADSRAHERAVAVGIRSGDEVQIVSGVKPGEQVIVEGALGLDDNTRVAIAGNESADK